MNWNNLKQILTPLAVGVQVNILLMLSKVVLFHVRKSAPKMGSVVCVRNCWENLWPQNVNLNVQNL